MAYPLHMYDVQDAIVLQTFQPHFWTVGRQVNLITMSKIKQGCAMRPNDALSQYSMPCASDGAEVGREKGVRLH